jgi:hypothetical protein
MFCDSVRKQIVKTKMINVLLRSQEGEVIEKDRDYNKSV